MSTRLLAMDALSPGRDLDHYIHTVSSFEILSAEEEATLGRALRDEGDLEAARRLVLSHLRFVVHMARSYAGYGLSQADLIQEGNVGLMKAVKRFDPDFGVRLVSFAVHWIKAEMHEFILRNWRIVKVATTKAQRKLFFNLRSQKKRLGWMNAEEVASVAETLGVSPEEVTRMEGRMAAFDAHFDLDDSEDDSAPMTAPAAYLAAEGADPAEQVEAEDWEDATVGALQQALAGLDERSRDIIQSRWLAEDKATLHTLADRYGVSAERIRQLELGALKKLKGAIAA